ncbi:hypothetical protein EDC04DRAFT_2638053, partial [Pisolithus marmoratus]
MFVIDPRPSYEYYDMPYISSPWTRDHCFGGALAQAEAARRAKHARKQREYHQRLQRQALLGALRAQMPGGFALDDDDEYDPPLSPNPPRQGYPWHAPTYFDWGRGNHCNNPYFAHGSCPQNLAELRTRAREDGLGMKETLGRAEPSPPDRHRPAPTDSQMSTSRPISIPIEDLESKGKSKQVGMDVPSPADELTSASESETDSEVERATDPRAIQESISSIAEIDASFEKLENEFVFPDELDFESSSLPELKLAYTSRNAPVRYYDHALQELLSKLDAVPSYGSARVREARRAMVTKVERALERLEEEIEGRKDVATWKMSKAANGVAVLEEQEGDEGKEVVEGGDVEMDDEVTGGQSESAAAGNAGEGEEEVKRDDRMENGGSPTERQDELDVEDALDTSTAEPAASLSHSTSALETGVETVPLPLAPVTTNGQADATRTRGEVTIVSSTSEEDTSDTSEPVELMPTGHPLESLLSMEDVEADAFLLRQPSSPPSPTAVSSASTNSDMEEEALLVEMPDNEHEHDEDTWVSV